MGLFLYLLRVLSQPCIRGSVKVALASSILAAAAKLADGEWDYLKKIMPNDRAFGLFASTVSFLLVFRTVRALNRYFLGASAAYHMTGAWFDAASSLFAFTRCATASCDQVREFKHMLVRLFSLLSMLCLEDLENCEDVGKRQASHFIVIDAAGIDPAMIKIIENSKCKAEVVLQMIQCLIVDNLANGVLAVPPPILTRALQDLGNGMLKFHENLHISRVLIPFPLIAVTQWLLVIYALFTPFTMATWAAGPGGAAWITFVQVSVFFTLNQLACEVENPFSERFKEIRMGHIHHQMNLRLASLHSFPTTFISQNSRDSTDIETINTINMPSVWTPLRSTYSELSCREIACLQELTAVIGSNVYEIAPQPCTIEETTFSVTKSVTKSVETGIVSVPIGSPFVRSATFRRALDFPTLPSLDAETGSASRPMYAAGGEDGSGGNSSGVAPSRVGNDSTVNCHGQYKCNDSRCGYGQVTSNANTHGHDLDTCNETSVHAARERYILGL